MKKSRFLAILLCLMIVLSIAACSKDNSSGDSSTNTSGNNSGASDSGGNSGSSNSGNSANNNSPGNSGGSSNQSAPGRDTLTVAIESDPGTFNPIDFGGGGFFGVALCIMEPLWDIDEHGNITWLLATGYDEITPTHCTLHLREGATFSNGNPFTAEDVIFSWNVVLDSTAYVRVQSIDVENCKIIDDYTIDMYFTEFNVQRFVAYSDVVMYDSRTYNSQDFSGNPIGTGPYVLEDYVVNSSVWVKRRDDYWGVKPAIENLRFRVLAEPSQVVNALETGLIDIGRIQMMDYDYVNNLPGYTVVDSSEPSWARLSFNVTEDSVFHNLEARYAVCHAINRNAIINLIYSGRATLMYQPITSVAIDYEPRFDNLHETYSVGFDLALAKQYAQSSGLAGKTIRLMNNGSSDYITISEILQGMLKEIDVTVEIISYDAATFSTMARDSTAFDISVSNGICPNKFTGDPLFNGVRTSVIFSTPGAWAEFDAFMEIAPNSIYDPDPKVRGDTIVEMIKIYTRNCLTYAMCNFQSANAYSTDLQGPYVFRASQQRRFADMKFAP